MARNEPPLLIASEISSNNSSTVSCTGERLLRLARIRSARLAIDTRPSLVEAQPAPANSSDVLKSEGYMVEHRFEEANRLTFPHAQVFFSKCGRNSRGVRASWVMLAPAWLRVKMGYLTRRGVWLTFNVSSARRNRAPIQDGSICFVAHILACRSYFAFREICLSSHNQLNTGQKWLYSAN